MSNAATEQKKRRRLNPGPVLADDERMWTAEQVAQFFSASRNWVYQRAASGLLPHRKIGGLLRFVPAEIRALAHDGLYSADVGSMKQEG